MIGKVIIAYFILLGFVVNAQPTDTLKIKAEADSLFTVADSLLDDWQLDEAQLLYQTVITKYKQIGDKVNKARTITRIGEIKYYQNNLKESLAFFEKALSIYRELGERRGESLSLHNIGSIYDELSEFPKAIEYLERALIIKRELKDRKAEGSSLSAIGVIYTKLSNYTKAMEYFERALEISREFDDRKIESVVLNNIGIIYIRLFDYTKALEYFEKSLEIDRNLGDSRGEGYTLLNIGNIYDDLSDYLKALYYFEQSLEIFKEFDDHKAESIALMNIGNIYDDLSEYPKAMGYYDRALAKLDYLLELDKISIWLNMGSNYAEQGNYIKAEELFRRALEISIDLKIGDLTQVCYQNLAEFYTDQGLDSVAADNYAISIETAESIRGKLEVEGQKTTYSSGISGLYSKMVLSLLRLDRNEDAYNYVERSRARSFLDLLASGEVKVGKSRHEEFLEKEEESQDKEEEIEGQLIAAEEDTVLYASLRGKLEEQRGLSAVEMKEKKEYEPELASLVTVNSLTLSEVQALLDKETVLEYFLTDEKTLIWLITKDNAEVYQVDIGGDSLKVMVEDYRSSIAKLSDIDEQSSAFYNLLIAPAVKKIETEKLVIIPHGILHYLPFQALQDEKGKYLLEKYQISYLPSASMMKYIIPKKRRKGKKVLALGNPKLDNPGYASITFAEKEVKAISKQYRKSKIFIGEDATEDNFRELAPDYDILHLACHAELNSAYPLFSGLLLSSNEEHDGELDVHELFTMDLNAYLVVLSACQTGLGHLTNGDELVGLSRAFIYAGTPSIISSLWMVEDESTSFLMERFYTHLQKKNKAKSLRMAQLETKEKYEHPLYWAPFVLVGDSE